MKGIRLYFAKATLDRGQPLYPREMIHMRGIRHEQPNNLQGTLPVDIRGKGFNALVKTLTELDLAGICTWTMRKRSYFGALQARGNTLRLSTLRYADEVIPVKSLELQDVALSEKELRIGSELIEKMSAPFEPAKFENEHQKKLLDLIEKKARGEKIVVLRPRRLKPTKSDQLLRTLEASLKKAA